jgi:hypothetical protein
MNTPHNPEVPDGLLRQLSGLPQQWTIRECFAFTKLIDAFNVLLFVWVGRDRTKVLQRVTDLISETDRRLSIDATIGERSEDYAVLFMLIRHRSSNPVENYQALQKLAATLDKQFTGSELPGEDFIASDRARMVIETPDRPGVLCVVTRVIADLGINLRKVKSRIWKMPQQEGMCRLTFGLDLPPQKQKPNLLEELRGRLAKEKELLEAKIDFGPARRRAASRSSPARKGKRRQEGV